MLRVVICYQKQPSEFYLSISQVKIRSCVGYQETINDEYILWLCIWMMNKIYKGKCDNW